MKKSRKEDEKLIKGNEKEKENENQNKHENEYEILRKENENENKNEQLKKIPQLKMLQLKNQ